MRNHLRCSAAAPFAESRTPGATGWGAAAGGGQRINDIEFHLPYGGLDVSTVHDTRGDATYVHYDSQAESQSPPHTHSYTTKATPTTIPGCQPGRLLHVALREVFVREDSPLKPEL
eukprot:6205362-Pleurochrysis_carterae.AAC.1